MIKIFTVTFCVDLILFFEFLGSCAVQCIGVEVHTLWTQLTMLMLFFSGLSLNFVLLNVGFSVKASYLWSVAIFETSHHCLFSLWAGLLFVFNLKAPLPMTLLAAEYGRNCYEAPECYSLPLWNYGLESNLVP